MDFASLAPLVIERLGPSRPSSVTDEWVQSLLQEAGVRLTARIKNLDARIAAGQVDLALAQWTVINAVCRVVRNPDGAQSQSAGPFSVTRPALEGSANVWFPESDIEALVGSNVAAVGTIRTSVPSWSGRAWR